MTAANVTVEIFSIILSILMMFCFAITPGKPSIQTNLFRKMLAANACALISDCITWIFENRLIMNICEYLTFLFGYLLLTLYTVYLCYYIGQSKKKIRKIAKIVSILCIVCMVFVATNFWTHAFFDFEGATYIRGEYFILTQIFPFLLLMFDCGSVLAHSKKLDVRDLLILLSYLILPIATLIFDQYFYGISFVFVASTLSLFMIYITIFLDQQTRLLQRDAELSDAKLELAISQIQPHFLYNALNSIAQLCSMAGANEAENATVEFAKYLRGNLDSLKTHTPILFSKELEHTKTYTELEKMRFGDDLRISYDIQCTSFLIPPLTLQPIVENAIKHGVGKKENGGQVSISTYDDEKDYYIVVCDDGVGFDTSKPKNDTERSHLGIDNVKARLSAMVDGTLSIKSESGKGTTVTITVPKKKE